MGLRLRLVLLHLPLLPGRPLQKVETPGEKWQTTTFTSVEEDPLMEGLQKAWCSLCGISLRYCIMFRIRSQVPDRENCRAAEREQEQFLLHFKSYL